jgi:hypothetical protein
MSMKWNPAPGTGIPFTRLILLGTALLVASGFAITGLSHRHADTRYQLVLDVQDPGEARCYWGTAWEPNATVLIDHDASDGRLVTFKTRYPFVDGCWWEGAEVLTPMADGRYSYTYSDHLVSCEEGAEPAEACTRSGVVTAVPLK